ncbi:hypothetical protein LCGC14_0987640 [marine sediment metagenome]|uniref:Uncharacterized protein n=1 Tax=marine sediment metagenome TaxID=412755 RepID=A0A0F9NTE1_9ZZZZ
MSGSYFRAARNVELSTIQYLETQIDASWSNVAVIKSFYKAYARDNSPPIVCIRLMDQNTDYLEIGATTLDDIYNIAIDIFARSDGQRMDLADFILNEIKDSWVYNTYSQTSDKSGVTATAAGRVRVVSFVENGKVDLGDTEESRDRYRHSIIFSVKRDV